MIYGAAILKELNTTTFIVLFVMSLRSYTKYDKL
jgi:hypothetical protein